MATDSLEGLRANKDEKGKSSTVIGQKDVASYFLVFDYSGNHIAPGVIICSFSRVVSPTFMKYPG